MSLRGVYIAEFWPGPGAGFSRAAVAQGARAVYAICANDEDAAVYGTLFDCANVDVLAPRAPCAEEERPFADEHSEGEQVADPEPSQYHGLQSIERMFAVLQGLGPPRTGERTNDEAGGGRVRIHVHATFAYSTFDETLFTALSTSLRALIEQSAVELSFTIDAPFNREIPPGWGFHKEVDLFSWGVPQSRRRSQIASHESFLEDVSSSGPTSPTWAALLGLPDSAVVFNDYWSLDRIKKWIQGNKAAPHAKHRWPQFRRADAPFYCLGRRRNYLILPGGFRPDDATVTDLAASRYLTINEKTRLMTFEPGRMYPAFIRRSRLTPLEECTPLAVCKVLVDRLAALVVGTHAP